MQLSRLLLHLVLEAFILGSMGSLQGQQVCLLADSVLEVVQNLPHHHLVLHPLHVVLTMTEMWGAGGDILTSLREYVINMNKS